MKPSVFSYHRPSTVCEALALLAGHGIDAKVIAGGQSLVPMMNMRLAQPTHVIDLNALEELTGIARTAGTLSIGALTRHHELATSLLVRDGCPLLARAAGTIGHFAIRQRGTLGGSMANADPAAQLPLIARTLNARIKVAASGGTREIDAADFLLATMTTSLEADEIITAVDFPCAQPGEKQGFELFSRRQGDFAIAACAVTTVVEAGRLAALRIGIGGVGDVPVTLDEVAADFEGAFADATTVARIGKRAAAAVEPADHPHISAAYQRDLVEALTARALARACGIDALNTAHNT
ncbi:xanthine dehydrogenase family protein subunit M [Paraburkholderia sp. J11-2]|uniref:FAD binding domain-containing protein n=1 Tax=Paraburkholderia sp. J11-2 TaxID=2805431 RepID=UPI002AB7315D|nr:xanthine dehydrogenase family protein subunit M [Paraburkholderia sp. J11-2]